MSEEQSSRKKFLKLLGLAAGATLVSKTGLAKGFDQTEIKKLTPPQQEFMNEYGKWMDDFTQVVREQKEKPDDLDNLKQHPRLNTSIMTNLSEIRNVIL